MFLNTATTSELSATLSEDLNSELNQYQYAHLSNILKHSATTSESPTTGESATSKFKLIKVQCVQKRTI